MSAGRTTVQNTEEKPSAGRLFIPSLVVAFFSTYILETLTGVFLVDVATEFFGSSNPVAIATTGQLISISSGVSVVFAVLLGFLSVRYNHKKLLLMGCFSVTLGILGCFLATDFLFMQFFFPIEGIGTAVIGAMTFALVGEFFIVSRRPKAIGWILAGNSLAGIISSLLISLFFSGAEGWRSYLLLFALPISIISIATVFFGVPSAPQKPKTVGREAYLNSYKQVFLKKSAASCLFGAMFRQAGLAWVVVYSATFFREQFGLSIASVALLSLIAGVIFVLALIIGGQLVHRVGRKRQLVATLVASSPALMMVAFVPNLWIVLILSWVGGFIYGMSFPANTSLILEQAPESRGTMMSMSTIFVTFGMGLGAALGGAALIVYGWTGLILTFAAMQLIAAAIFFFLTQDPCRT
jgi:MFS transporter, DHA1 family, inner membrane transport protein